MTRFSALIFLEKGNLVPIGTATDGLANFFVFAKIFAKMREKTCVIDYVDTVSARSLNTSTQCRHGR